MQETFIDTTEALAQFCAGVAGSDWLAVDTEFIRERTYYPRLCLIQVANADQAAAIDPLTLTDLSPLQALFDDERITKLFHAGQQDLEIFLQRFGRLPAPLFDTQPAAALLGLGDQLGYASLVEQVLGVKLEKDHSRTDWCRRPLSEGQLRYALDDVIYLGQLYQRMKQLLEDKGRLRWLDAEFARMADPASYQVDVRALWKKVKGWQHLKGLRLAVLRELAAWREQQAVARNLPRRWVLKDDVLLELARRMPADSRQLMAVRGVEGGFLRHNAEAVLACINRARALPEEQWPRPPRRRDKPSASEEALLDYLSAALRLMALEAGLSPQAIASRKDLHALLKNDENAALLKGWRLSLAGQPLQRLLHEGASLKISNGRLEVCLE